MWNRWNRWKSTLNRQQLKLIGLSSLFLFTFGLANVAPAFAAEDEDYNFSWLDPDKKIYVLQNRKYRKARKINLSLLGGSGIAETYRQTWQIEPRLGVWFNEDWGVEAFFVNRWNTPNNAYQALVEATGSGLSPLIREVNTMYGALLNWAPWYAKINVFNSILYFDWTFSLGVGMMNTSIGPKTKTDPSSAAQWVDQNLFAVYLGTGQIFHLSQKFDIRFEGMGHFYSAPVYGGLAGAPTDSSLFSSFVFSLGLGVKL